MQFVESIARCIVYGKTLYSIAVVAERNRQFVENIARRIVYGKTQY
jgi:hypothetical protein